MQMVAATCPERFSGESTLFEPHESGLPAGLLASPCLLKVVLGTVRIPVVNVGTAEVLLYSRTHLGSLSAAQVVSLPAGVTEVEPTVATVSSQAAPLPVLDRMASLELSALTEQERERIRALLRKYSSVFAAHGGTWVYESHLAQHTPS